MARLFINALKERALTKEQREEAVSLCPFGAIELSRGELEINSGCKMCKLCVRNGPEGIFEYVENEALSDAPPQTDKGAYRGIAVYIDNAEGSIHPVSLELLGKARELADKVNHPVFALFIGSNISGVAEGLLHYGVDEVFFYDSPLLENFLPEPYTNVFADFVEKVRPSSILIGATMAGRSLAPRVAARCRTGLTADCTKLDIKENTDLVQIRPAFGGNIMAQIVTPKHRPQIATVRYKIFAAPERSERPSGKVTQCSIAEEKMVGRVQLVRITKNEKKLSIADADVIVAAGRGIKSQKDMAMVRELADLLGGQVASTRPLVETGWVEPQRQVGLSGRTVKPKLIITLGVSGSVQFRAGMENADIIVSVNRDENAQIFDVSHYAIVGDIYEVVPKLIEQIRRGEGSDRHV
ncbi:MAG: FAD-binding protein [Clostridiales Family XIII bacterium]|jgi:electron transfer flavoprotein alpha subunit|nr:FAD-binding protein [Clostridiales Family XIII bacterium]